MTGEMSSSEVTPDNYPDLFELKENLESIGVKAEARPWDQYLGPYLQAEYNGVHFDVWYNTKHVDIFVIKYRYKGRVYFYEFHRFDWNSPICHLEEMFGGKLGKMIDDLDKINRKILEDDFNRDVGKFHTWLETGRPRDFNAKPTIDYETKLFTINIRPFQELPYTPEAWERIEDKVADILKQEGISGHVESEATGNSTSF